MNKKTLNRAVVSFKQVGDTNSNMSSACKFLSFEEIVHGRDATVRITDDGMLFVVDLVVVVTGKSRDDASKVIRMIPENIFQSTKYVMHSMPGKGMGRTKLLKFEDAIELIMVLPGKISKVCRKQMAEIIIRYLDGDSSLLNEIVENHNVGRVNSYANFVQRICADTEKETKSVTSFGYLYALSSPAFPGHIKIGRSIDVFRRLAQLNTGCAPNPHVVIATAPTFNNVKDEKKAHRFFSKFRGAGEFFKVSEEVVKRYFKHVVTARFRWELQKRTDSWNGVMV